MRKETFSWWEQAQAELAAAKKNIGIGEYSTAVFLCQQATEKALKALYIERKREEARTHDLVEIASALDVPKTLLKNLFDLGPEYVVSRYPDASYGAPYRLYDKEKAEARHKQAR